jgi:uncharacterized membrane protein YoaK (UPF0700 family)
MIPGVCRIGLQRSVFASKRPSRRTTATLVVTMTTGMVEAVSFVGLGYVFTAMMTGNLLFIGFELAGVSSAVSQNISLTQTVVALMAFALGALTGHRLNGVLAGRNDRWLALVAFVMGLLFVLAAVVAIGLRGHPGHVTTRHLVVIFVLAATMGWRNTTVRRAAVPDLLVTLVTGSLTGLFMGSLRDEHAWRRGAAVVAIVLGAFLGTLLLRLNPTAALLATAAVQFVAAGILRGEEVAGKR